MNDASGYDSDRKEKFLSPPTHTHTLIIIFDSKGDRRNKSYFTLYRKAMCALWTFKIYCNIKKFFSIQ